MIPYLALLTIAQVPALSFEQVGLMVVALMVGSKWYWDWRKDQREEARQHEPRANPPLHERYVAQTTYLADLKVIDERFTKATESRKKMHEELDDHGERIASLEKGEKHTEVTLASIDNKLTVILGRITKS